MEYRISTNILSTCTIWLQIWSLHTRVTPDFSGTSGTNMTMAIIQLEKMQMLRKLKSGVTRVWRIQICNQIIQIDNIFVDIRYSIVWLNYFYINKLTPLGIPKIRNFPQVNANTSYLIYLHISISFLEPNLALSQ